MGPIPLSAHALLGIIVMAGLCFVFGVVGSAIEICDTWRRERTASPEKLPSDDPLPHVKCSPPVFVGGGGHEAYQHDGTRRVGCGTGGAVRHG